MKLAVVSTMSGLPWGASEELWSAAAALLLQRGHRVAVSVDGGWGRAPELDRLAAAGACVHRRRGGLGRRLAELGDRLARAAASPRPAAALARRRRDTAPWRRWLRATAPDLALISLGAHRDDPAPALACREEGVPYALLLHSVDPGRWLEGPEEVGRARRAWGGARRAFFVSAANRDLLADQLAAELPPSRVVANPLAVRPAEPLPWPEAGPSDGGLLRLACVGRLGCWQKGQDLVVEVLARERWRRRPVEVTFWGRDHGNRRQLRDLARMRGVGERVRFAGHTADPAQIWRSSHGLLLPSRYEGMPMVTAEAMFCGRVPVVTACGRNREWVDDGDSGFLAPAATVDLVDRCLERAWARRDDWPAIGRRAAERIAGRYDPSPAASFADALLDLAAPGAGVGSAPFEPTPVSKVILFPW